MSLFTTFPRFLLYKWYYMYFRALKERQIRTLEAAIQPGRRERWLNMRRGEAVHPPQAGSPCHGSRSPEPVTRAVFALHQSCWRWRRAQCVIKVVDEESAFKFSLFYTAHYHKLQISLRGLNNMYTYDITVPGPHVGSAHAHLHPLLLQRDPSDGDPGGCV